MRRILFLPDVHQRRGKLNKVGVAVTFVEQGGTYPIHEDYRADVPLVADKQLREALRDFAAGSGPLIGVRHAMVPINRVTSQMMRRATPPPPPSPRVQRVMSRNERGAMPSLHIFNVTGVMLNGRNDTLENGFRELSPTQLLTFAPIPASRASDAPVQVIADTGKALDGFLAQLPPRSPQVFVLGVGRSFGGYMLLKALSEQLERFSRFSRVVAVESPLAPDVVVNIPPLMPVLLPAARHYRERAEHAAAMAAALCDEQIHKTLTIGNTVDSVIPPASMRLPAVSRVVHWVQGMNAASAVNPGPSHVVLPRFTPGFSIGTALLPHSYREHLTWSAAKVAVIQELIRATLPLAKVGS